MFFRQKWSGSRVYLQVIENRWEGGETLGQYGHSKDHPHDWQSIARMHQSHKRDSMRPTQCDPMTQWDIVRDQARRLEPVYAELLRQAAGGDIVYNDDTTVKILELMGKRARQRTLAEGSAEGGTGAKQPTGLFTSGIVSTHEGRRIALFCVLPASMQKLLRRSGGWRSARKTGSPALLVTCGYIVVAAERLSIIDSGRRDQPGADEASDSRPLARKLPACCFLAV